jgi:hypothetical protein
MGKLAGWLAEQEINHPRLLARKSFQAKSSSVYALQLLNSYEMEYMLKQAMQT